MQVNSVNHPKHYTILEDNEVIDLIRYHFDRIDDSPLILSGYQYYLYANIIEYVLRWPFKNGVEDLKKAERNIKHLIEDLESE